MGVPKAMNLVSTKRKTAKWRLKIKEYLRDSASIAATYSRVPQILVILHFLESHQKSAKLGIEATESPQFIHLN